MDLLDAIHMTDKELQNLAQAAFKLLLATILAGALGLERERKGRPAGLRTHVLVCLGATLMMLVTELYSEAWRAAGYVQGLDPSRVVQGIITGVGFLGAGTIMRVAGEPHGLTTAALIWFVAGLGVAIGTGYYLLSVLATVVCLVILVLLAAVEDYVPSRQLYRLFIRLPDSKDRLDVLESLISGGGACHILASRCRYLDGGAIAEYTFHIEAKAKSEFRALLTRVTAQYADVPEIVLDSAQLET